MKLVLLVAGQARSLSYLGLLTGQACIIQSLKGLAFASCIPLLLRTATAQVRRAISAAVGTVTVFPCASVHNVALGTTAEGAGGYHRFRPGRCINIGTAVGSGSASPSGTASYPVNISSSVQV